MRLCACVITYYPDVEMLKQNISAYYDYVDQIIIWQNTPAADRKNYELSPNDKILYLGEDKNSISYALNRTLKWCTDNGFTHLLTMDQDSIFDHFDSYLLNAEKRMRKEDCIECGPEVNQQKLLSGESKEKKYIITSGAIVNVNLALKAGGYREEFAVDGIDLDFGFRANSKGYKVYQIGGGMLKQSFGNTTNNNGHTIVAYSPNRFYNTVKTQWMLWTEYPQYFHKMKFLYIYYLGFPRNIICYQDKKLAKLKAIVKGTVEGLKYMISK